MAKSTVNFIVNKKQISSAAVRKVPCMSSSSFRQSFSSKSNTASRSSPSTRLSAIFAKSTVYFQAEFDVTKQKSATSVAAPCDLAAVVFRLTMDIQSDLEQKGVCVVSIQVKTNTLSKPGFEINLETNNLISEEV